MLINIEKKTLANKHYRKVIYTDKWQQVVLMSLEVGESIPCESHDGTQFFRIESGNGSAKVEGKRGSIKLKNNSVLVVPANTKHEIKNTSKKYSLKLYTIYSPPQHKPKNVKKRQ